MNKVIVKLDNAEYEVNIGNGLLPKCGEIISNIHPACRVGLITDTNVASHYLQIVGKSLMSEGFEVFTTVIDSGEASKSIENYNCILEFLADNEITRADIVIALGGGVVGDLAGFAAATYMRGIPYVQIPTTLLAMVDSSVGGKTAIDLAAGKNLCGAFWQPISVICSVDALDTLEKKYFDDGIAEIIKYGMLGNEKILQVINDCINDKDNLKAATKPFMAEIIEESVKTKLLFVENDVLDTDKRQYLNFGHTIGHAIEHASRYALTHGHAVAIGMCMITKAYEELGVTKSGTYEELQSLINRCGLPTTTIIPAEDLYNAALSDKKRRGLNITIVVPISMGKCELQTISIKELQDIINLGVK